MASRICIYVEPRDAWIGAYVAADAVYVCLLPFVVIRWARRVRDPADFELFCRVAGIEPGPEAMAAYLREVHGWDGQMAEVTEEESHDGD
jgi:hypothetical protein